MVTFAVATRQTKKIMQQSPEVLQAKQRFGIIGNAPALVGAIERTLQVAPIDLTVLIIGESGTGKEFFPKIIHQYSPRKHAKYIAVNCGAIPEGTIDSELFGHEKGAFTGAVASRKGYFEEANGGTIFLDEVAELPLTTQARLLRVLESGEFIKVGSSTVQKTNIRVVAATNVNMLEAVRQGKFREDLFYRLSTVQIDVPPLRDRRNDILLLARKFAADFAERYRLPQITFSESGRNALERYRWPGNVRQLKNVVEQVSLFNAGQDVTSEILSPYLPAAASAPAVVGRDHSYESEREMLMSLIMSMQKRIDALEAERNEVVKSNSFDELSNNFAMRNSDVHYSVSSSHVDPRGIKIDRSPRFSLPRIDVDEDVEPEGFTAYSEEESTPPATMREREREAIREALERHGGNRREAADELQISQRTLYRKIKDYGLE